MIPKWAIKLIYKPGTEDIYWEKIIAGIVVLVGFALFVYYNNTRLDRLERERNEYKRYVIGVATSEHNNIKGSMVIDYEYLFAGKQYSNSISTKKWLLGKPDTHGGRYYVQLAFNNPSNAEMLLGEPVPDSIKDSPDSGWAYLPPEAAR